MTLTAIFRAVVADHSLWFDEQASVFFSDQPFLRLWSDWMLRETNPALYYSLLKMWRAVAGSSDLGIRLLSVLASLLALALTNRLTTRLYGHRAGLVAAVLVAVSGQHLYFAEQARAYIFLLDALLIAIDALASLTARDAGRTRLVRAALTYAVAATAAIYLHTTAILFPAIATLAVLAANPRRFLAAPRLLGPLIGADLLILVGSGWAIRQTVLQIFQHSSNIAPIGLVRPSEIGMQLVHTLFLAAGPGYRLVSAIATALAVLALGFAWVDRRCYETRLLVALGVIAILTFSVLGMAIPVFVPRTIFWISVVPTILAAAAIARLCPAPVRWGVLGTVVTALVLDTARLVPTLEQEDWNTPVKVLVRHPGAVLAVQGEATAVLANSNCRRQLRLAVCPYPIINVTDPQDHYDTWAAGSYFGPKVTADRLSDVVGEHPVFLFRKNFGHDLLGLLHSQGRGAGVPADGPPLLGPFSATAF